MKSRLFAVGLLLCPGCFPFGQMEQDLKEAEALSSFRLREAEVSNTGELKRAGYRITGSGDLLIVLVHGAPGSSGDWAGFLKRPQDFGARLMAVDRPGYGLSFAGGPERSLARQAALIASAIREERHGPVILAGHSMGGAVAARICMDYPDLCSGLLFVAASVDPQLEVLEWYHKAADSGAVRWILPRDIDTANQEILPLKQELTDMLPYWKTVRAPSIVIQGGADRLVPPGNAVFLKQSLPDLELVFDPDMNHFVPWTRPELIDQALLRLIERIKGPGH